MILQAYLLNCISIEHWQETGSPFLLSGPQFSHQYNGDDGAGAADAAWSSPRAHLLWTGNRLKPPVRVTEKGFFLPPCSPASSPQTSLEKTSPCPPRKAKSRGKAVSFPDETQVPRGHQLLHQGEGHSDKEPNLNACNVAVCTVGCLRHLLGVSHCK